MLHQVQRAIEPAQSLQSVLNRWGQIRVALREGRRRRRPKLYNSHCKLSAYGPRACGGLAGRPALGHAYSSGVAARQELIGIANQMVIALHQRVGSSCGGRFERAQKLGYAHSPEE